MKAHLRMGGEGSEGGEVPNPVRAAAPSHPLLLTHPCSFSLLPFLRELGAVTLPPFWRHASLPFLT